MCKKQEQCACKRVQCICACVDACAVCVCVVKKKQGERSELSSVMRRSVSKELQRANMSAAYDSVATSSRTSSVRPQRRSAKAVHRRRNSRK